MEFPNPWPAVIRARTPRTVSPGWSLEVAVHPATPITVFPLVMNGLVQGSMSCPTSMTWLSVHRCPASPTRTSSAMAAAPAVHFRPSNLGENRFRAAGEAISAAAEVSFETASGARKVCEICPVRPVPDPSLRRHGHACGNEPHIQHPARRIALLTWPATPAPSARATQIGSASMVGDGIALAIP